MKKSRITIISILTLITLLLQFVTSIAPGQSAAAGYNCANQTQIPQIECEVLVELYKSTDGDNWINNANWLVTDSPGDWYGVKVVNGRVYEINLSHNGLTGMIPESLFSIPQLRRLELRGNTLEGEIPEPLKYISDIGYRAEIEAEWDSLYREHMAEMGTDLLDWIDSESTAKREYIPPTPEVIAENQAQVRSFDCSTVTDVPQIECEALVALYESTNGARWWNNTNWLVSSRISDWYGISVESQKIVSIKLPNNRLYGNLPTQFFNLSYLQHLDLSYNYLDGNIPSDLGNLLALSYLDLWNNQFSGSVPSEIGNLSNLTHLDISSMRYQDPITLLHIGGLKTIPSTIGNLTNLTYLNIGYNCFSSLPSSLGNLINLEHLDIRNNYNVTATNDYCYGISTIPSSIGNLTKLKKLIAYDNKHSGAIPKEFGNLINLVELKLYYNLFSSIPPELGNLTKLSVLNLWTNKLVGTIPDYFMNLTSLTYLNLSRNSLSGTLPISLGKLNNLQGLYIYDNQFTGAIPLSYINMSNLQNFSFYKTSLCEPSTPEFINWKNSVTNWNGTDIMCDEDPFCSNVTDISITECQAVISLYHHSNGPDWYNKSNWLNSTTVGDWYGVTVVDNLVTQLNLSNNGLSGIVPSSIGNLVNTINIDIGQNQLTGSLPSEIGDLTKLQSLTLYSNQFSRSIPLSFINLFNLDYFNFQNTHLCEPNTSEFSAWKATVNTWLSTGIICPNEVDLDVSESKVELAGSQNDLKSEQPYSTVIEVDVQNHGLAPATNVKVEFFDGHPTSGTLLSSTTITSIDAGETKVVQGTWATFTSPGSANIYVRVDSNETDTNPSNNISNAGTNAYVAFADFSYDPDTFHFTNWRLDFDKYKSGLFSYSIALNLSYLQLMLFTEYVPLFLYILAGSGGHCYGMATASIIYWDTPSAKPVSKNTYDMIQADIEYDIQHMLMRQLIKEGPIFTAGNLFPSLVSPSAAFNTTRGRLEASENPSLLSFSTDDWGHAVTAYKTVEIGSRKYIYYYDNNSPMWVNQPISPDIMELDEVNDLFLIAMKNDQYEIDQAFATQPVRSNSEITFKLIEEVITAALKLINESNRIQGYFSWIRSEPQLENDYSSLLSEDEIRTIDPPNHFLIIDDTGSRLGYDQGIFINEIPDAEFFILGSGYYWLVPLDVKYSLEIGSTDIEEGSLSLAIPINDYLIRSTVFHNINFNADRLATVMFSQTISDIYFSIEGQSEIYPNFDEVIDLDEGLSQYHELYLPLISH